MGAPEKPLRVCVVLEHACVYVCEKRRVCFAVRDRLTQVSSMKAEKSKHELQKERDLHS